MLIPSGFDPLPGAGVQFPTSAEKTQNLLGPRLEFRQLGDISPCLWKWIEFIGILNPVVKAYSQAGAMREQIQCTKVTYSGMSGGISLTKVALGHNALALGQFQARKGCYNGIII